MAKDIKITNAVGELEFVTETLSYLWDNVLSTGDYDSQPGVVWEIMNGVLPTQIERLQNIVKELSEDGEASEPQTEASTE